MNWATRDIYPFSAIVGQEKMKRALILNAISPSVGGVLIRGEKGTAKSTAVRALAAILPEIEVVSGCPFNCDPHQHERLCPACRERVKQGHPLPVRKRRIKVVDLPLGATEDRVAGSLDLEYAIKEGKRRFEPGLLASAHRGILYIDEVNLLDDHIVDVILDAAAMGVNIVEREGVAYVHAAEFILIGTMNPEEGELRPQLLDRFGMCIEVEGIDNPQYRAALTRLIERFQQNESEVALEFQEQQEYLRKRIARSRKRLTHVKISDEMCRLCAKLALEAGVAGHRADIIMRSTALAISAYEGRDEVTAEDVNEAAELVLLHRMRIFPPSSQNQTEKRERRQEEPSEEDEQPKRNEERPEGEDRQKGGEPEKREQKEAGGEQENRIADIAATETMFPIGARFKVKSIQTERDRILRKGSGRRSRSRTSSKVGRYATATMQRKTHDLALDATLRAAAPYQRQRSRRENVAIAIEDCDIREKIREKRIGNFIVFVVDASGSMGPGRRMSETKGAILSLLLDAYQKRDRVAMVAFKGDRAELLLPPTNSIELTHKLLEELPTGGKTPLPHGLSLGYQIIQNHFRKDRDIYPLLILISDGKANVSQCGGKPLTEAMEEAERIKEDGRVRSLVIDVEKPGLISFGLARELSLRMGAKYFKIEDLKADMLVEVLREDLLA